MLGKVEICGVNTAQLKTLSNDEMNNLVDELLAISTPNYTPDGKTVLSILKEEDIEKMFK